MKRNLAQPIRVLFLTLGAIWHSALGGDIDPVLVGSWTAPPTNVQPSRIATSGNYAFVLQPEAAYLAIIDITNPARPLQVGTLSTTAISGDVEVVGGLAYVAGPWFDEEAREWWNGLRVIDISDPANPRRLGRCSISTENITRLAVAGNHAYLVSYDGLFVIDVSDPTRPRSLAEFESGAGEDVAVSGKLAYVASGTGLAVIDISEPANPRRVGAVGGFYHSVAISENYAYVGGHEREPLSFASLLVVDVRNPTKPYVVGGYGPTGDPNGIAVSGAYAYLSTITGFQAIDVSDPARPQPVASNSTPAFDIAVSQNRILVAAYPGLQILQMPPFLKSILKEGSTMKLEWEGFGPARLQRATRLTNPDWVDLPGFEGTNTATLTINNGTEFFRLVRP